MKSAIFLIFALSILSYSSAPKNGELGQTKILDERLALQEVQLREIPPKQRVEALTATYTASVSASNFDESCSGVPVDELEGLFRATDLMAFYHRTPEWVSRVDCLHQALERNGMESIYHRRRLHGLFIALRRFDDANRLQSRLGMNVPTLPSLNPPGDRGLSVIRLTEAGPLEHFILAPPSGSGTQVIAFVHPFCGFSRRALDSIVDGPDYAWLRPYLQLVVPREPLWPEAAMRKWNDIHPSHPMYAESMGQEWLAMEAHETPVFHLVKNGQVISTAIGWKGRGGDLKALREALEKI